MVLKYEAKVNAYYVRHTFMNTDQYQRIINQYDIGTLVQDITMTVVNHLKGKERLTQTFSLRKRQSSRDSKR